MLDQVKLLLGQAANIRRFNVLMSFMSGKKKVEVMLKEICGGIQGQLKNVVWIKVYQRQEGCNIFSKIGQN